MDIWSNLSDSEGDTQTKKRRFRVRAKRLMLTYKSHINKDELAQFLRDNGATRVELAHETGDEHHPYLHTHAVIEFQSPIEIKSERKLDFQGLHCNIKSIKSERHWLHSLKYLAKEDPSNAHLKKTEESLVEKIWNKDSLGEALKECTKHSEIIPTIACFERRPIDKLEIPPPNEWRQWQADLIEYLGNPPHEREIYWVVDPRGGCGKSRITRYLAVNYGVMAVSYFNRTADFMTALDSALEADTWDGRIIIADLPRDAERKNIYEPLEAVKNGMIQTTKYKGRTRWIEIPHVVVFSNFHPDTRKLSSDRWHIITIKENYQGQLTDVSP